jgi:hypothetical protein
VIVPDEPGRLLTEFLPQFFARLAAPEGTAESVRPQLHPQLQPQAHPPLHRAPAPVGIAVRVVGAGEWTLRIAGTKLVVEPGAAEGAALQISLSVRDWGALVVAPLSRALEQKPSADAPARGALWARLARWDAETVDLLRRQPGGVLVRVADAGTSRNVALTPGSQPHSLETADCIIDCALPDLLELQAKRKNPLDLFYAGQIRISGDAQVALAMAGLFL